MEKIRLMRVFTSVARHQSFTKAAEEQELALQTISKYIKALEDDLGVQLFDRTTRQVKLTDTGRAYLAQCIELLEHFDDVENSVKSVHQAPQGKIRLTAPTGFGEFHLVRILGEFQIEYPDIEISLDLTNRKVAIVEEGFDLAIRIGELTDSSLIAKKLRDMRVCVCASPEFLAKRGKPQTPQDLENFECLIDTNFRGGRYWPFIVNGETLKVPVKGRFHCNSPNGIRKMARQGLGIGLCPLYTINQDLLDGSLVTLFEREEALCFGVYAVYPHRKHLSRRVRVLVDFIAKALRRAY